MVSEPWRWACSRVLESPELRIGLPAEALDHLLSAHKKKKRNVTVHPCGWTLPTLSSSAGCLYCKLRFQSTGTARSLLALRVSMSPARCCCCHLLLAAACFIVVCIQVTTVHDSSPKKLACGHTQQPTPPHPFRALPYLP